MSVVTLFLSPSLGRGTPEGQGVGRRRNRVKPTSGATRHLLPKEGGRSGMSSPSPPFLWKGDARRAGGWSRKAWEVLIESQSQILQEFLYIASRRSIIEGDARK